jgi:tetratricopeptide (TPR) repeat protein
MILRNILIKENCFFVAFAVWTLLSACDNRFGNYEILDVDSGNALEAYSFEYLEKEKDYLDSEHATMWLFVNKKYEWSNVQKSTVELLVETHPQNKEVNELCASYYLFIGEYPRALELNMQAEKLGTNTTEFYKTRSQIYSGLGRYDLAIDYINKAVMINSNDPEIYLSKGDIYLRLGDSLSALQYKEQAFFHDPSRMGIAYELAHLYVKSEMYEKAIVLIEELSSQNYQETSLAFLTVEIRERKGDYLGANNLLIDLLKKGELAAGKRLLNYYEQSKNYDSLVSVSSLILELDNKNLLALRSKAKAFDNKGYYSSALMYYDQVLDIDSLNEEALLGVSKIKGKIAYLRKIKEQRESIPTFDFGAPKRQENN